MQVSQKGLLDKTDFQEAVIGVLFPGFFHAGECLFFAFVFE